MGLRETLRRGDPRDGKRFLVELTQSIVVKPGEVEIEYRLPGPEKPETEDLVSPVSGITPVWWRWRESNPRPK